MRVRPIHCVGAVLLVLAGVVTPVHAAIGYALSFDGVDDYVDIPTTEYAFEDGDVFTIELWSRWFDGVRSLCAWRYQLERSRFRTRGSPEMSVQLGITNQEWNHVAIVYDGSGATKYLTGYVNGVQTGAVNATGSPLSAYDGRTLTLGMTRHSSGQYSRCMKDEIRIWNVARTVSDIQAHMGRGLSGNEDGLIGYWTFDEGAGTTAHDRSPRGNHGTVIGATWTTDAAPVAPGPAPAAAQGPSPSNGAVDVPRDVVLSWNPGGSAQTRDVYFGTVLDDLDAVARTDPRGVLVSQGQTATTYDPDGLLEYGRTYYWRVDEVNTPPDSTIFEGTVWSFTAEPYAYPLMDVIATASSFDTDLTPDRTVDESGLDPLGRHSTDGKDMWLTSEDEELPAWIQFEFPGLRRLQQMKVWNFNESFERFVGLGAKDVVIEYSLDGEEWIPFKDVVIPRAPAGDTYAGAEPIDLEGIETRFVRLVIETNWGGQPQTGLSEVQFLHVPIQAREPQPADGATDVAVDTDLIWRPGREVELQEIYLGTNADAVAAGTVPVGSQTQRTYTPPAPNLGTTYFWRVDQVGELGVYAGDLWSFTTQEFLVIDDFESYNDTDDEIFYTWVDGWEIDGNGSQVGHDIADGGTFGERNIVRSGRQSMPLYYENTGTAPISEAVRTFSPAQDWTVHGADTLILHVQGRPIAFLERDDGSIVIGAGGADIWGTADQFRYAAKRLTGNGSIVARVDSFIDTDPWVKVGVMIRESLEPGSRFAAVYSTPGNGVRFQARTLNGGSATSDTAVHTPEQAALRPPVWVKIERTDNMFNGFYSTDGQNWTPMSWNPQTINMGGSVYIGLAVTSHNVNVMTVAEFSGVEITGAVSGPWEVTAIGVEQPSNDAAPLYVVVEDSNGRSKVVTHPDPAITTATDWQQWRIPLSEFTAAGVNLSRVSKMYVGVGNRANPTPGAAGTVFIDDILFGRPIADE